MTMPLPFNRSEFVRILLGADIPPATVEAHADAIDAGLSQEIVLPADLAILKAEILAAVDERIRALEQRIDAKLRPIYFMCIVSLVLHAITVTKLFLS